MDQGILPFLEFPPEIRNLIYNVIFPEGTYFTTSQRMVNTNDEVPKRYARPSPAPRKHEKTTSTAPFWHYIGILGMNRSSRQEALDILQRNVTGRYGFMIAPDFKLIPETILDLIDTVEIGRHIVDSSKYRWFLRFPRLRRALLTTCIVDKCSFDIAISETSDAEERASCMTRIREFYDEQRAAYRFKISPEHYETRFPGLVDEYMPKRWKLREGNAPIEVLTKIYILDTEATPDHEPHEGVLVIVDWNGEKIKTLEWAMFTRVQRDDTTEEQVPGPFNANPWIMLGNS